MRSLSLVFAALLSLLLLTEVVLASPVLFDKLFAAYQPAYSGGYGGNQYGYYGSGGGGPSPTHRRKPKGRSYKDICRVVNPTPYALPGSVPYPAAPFCPY